MSEETQSKPLPGSKILMIGGAGTGKTSALATLPACGITPMVLFTEQGQISLRKAMKRLGVADDQVHYVNVAPAALSFAEMADTSNKINQLSYEGLTKMVDPHRSKYKQYIKAMTVMDRFVCDCHGKDFGSVDSWGTDRALCIDGLSGLSRMSKDLMLGGKPTAHQGEWGVSMDNIERLMEKLTTAVQCWVVVLSHLSPEKDDVTGAIKIYPYTLGNKLPPKLPRMFLDVINTIRNGDKFLWSTDTYNIELKGTNLPISGTLDPTFQLLVENWKSTGGVIAGSDNGGA